MAVRAVGKLQVAVVAVGCIAENELPRVSIEDDDGVIVATNQEQLLGSSSQWASCRVGKQKLHLERGSSQYDIKIAGPVGDYGHAFVRHCSRQRSTCLVDAET